ncbi:hypothetical protein [uncultured Pontibacter sp.]|uniref:hypothetical protein n=1 Tax=uncultured Pontibacter sp. TaxID=453356 RepID=UPI002634D28E|nr:hypothetical protein [uncultured Pontibacter sp.]
MKINLLLLFTFLFLSSCTSREKLASTRFATPHSEINATLYSETFFNPEGIVKRIIHLEFENGRSSEWEIHQAHYSDVVNLKVLQEDKQAFLIAEDNTGYAVWDLQMNKVIAERGIDESGNLGESGTAKDYMVHRALSKKQWVKVLDLNTAKQHILTTIDWH